MVGLRKGGVRVVVVGLGMVFAVGCQAQERSIADRESLVSDSQSPNALVQEGSVAAAGSMMSRRAAHRSTLLPNGKVLITGGMLANGGALASSEIFDAATGRFTAGAEMHAARVGHSATLLPNGKVLVAGGYNGEYLDSTDLYDPETGTFTSAGRMTTGRSGHTSVLLKDGTVLMAGGVGRGWTFLASAEIYDPATGRFTAVGNMASARESHTATLLEDGRVLVAGGHRDRRPNVRLYQTTEFYDPAKRAFAAGPDMTIRRHKHDAVRLADGRVLVMGGSDERDGAGAYRNAEVFDPSRGTFAAVRSNMHSDRYKLEGTAILLPTGKVLVAGGGSRVEIFDPATNSFNLVDGDLRERKLFAAATLLANGQVLITGGYSDGNTYSDRAWIYRA